MRILRAAHPRVGSEGRETTRKQKVPRLATEGADCIRHNDKRAMNALLALAATSFVAQQPTGAVSVVCASASACPRSAVTARAATTPVSLAAEAG
jgi:hypothetical protein